MIPENGAFTSIQKITQPTHTYKLDFQKNRVSQYTDELEAMEQMVYKALRTHRYRHEIYDWNYGIELDDLFGKDKSYVRAELKRRITECLTADDRVKQVDSFSFPEPQPNANNDRRTTVCVCFTVHTVFGPVNIMEDVKLDV